MPRTLLPVLAMILVTLPCGLTPGRPEAASTRLASLGADRGTYHSAAGFSIQYPTAWLRLDTGDYPIVFALQATSGTNLIEKRMEIDVREHAADCKQAAYGGETAGGSREPVVINGAELLYQIGAGIAAGNI
ncbi:MAG: hypothetical protein V1755_02015, partial [Chloroflexota bacterium]